jgi:hypothetical protein
MSSLRGGKLLHTVAGNAAGCFIWETETANQSEPAPDRRARAGALFT